MALAVYFPLSVLALCILISVEPSPDTKGPFESTRADVLVD